MSFQLRILLIFSLIYSLNRYAKWQIFLVVTLLNICWSYRCQRLRFPLVFLSCPLLLCLNFSKNSFLNRLCLADLSVVILCYTPALLKWMMVGCAEGNCSLIFWSLLSFGGPGSPDCDFCKYLSTFFPLFLHKIGKEGWGVWGMWLKLHNCFFPC